jgi:WD40 repeat protein
MPTFSPDGKILAVFSQNGVFLFDVATAKVLGQLKGKFFNVQPAPSFSGDGRRLALGSTFPAPRPLSVVLWDTATKKEIKTFTVQQNGSVDVALSPNGKVMATWGSGAPEGLNRPLPIQLWDVDSGKDLHALKIDGDLVVAAAFSPDGKRLAAVEDNSTLTIWDVATGARLRRGAVRSGLGTVLRYSPNGELLLAGTDKGAIQIWDAATGKRVGQCEGPCGSVGSIAFLGGDKVLATGLSHQSIYLWTVPLGVVLTPRGGHVSVVSTLAFSRDGKTLHSGSADGMSLWESATGKEVRRVEAPSEGDSSSNWSRAYQISGDGRFVAWTIPHGRDVGVTETATNQEIARLAKYTGGGVNDVAFAADGAAVAAVGSTIVDMQLTVLVQVWDLATGAERQRLKLPVGEEQNILIALSPGGAALAVSSQDLREREVHASLWHVTTGKQIATLPVGTQVRALRFSQDGALLATASHDGAIYLWDATNGNSIRTLASEKGRSSNALAFSPDGRTLAAVRSGIDGNDDKIELWELASGKLRAVFAGHRGDVRALAFSPDGRTLATGGDDTTILLWDVTGRTTLPAKLAKPTAAELAQLWADLDAADAARAHRAMARLTANPLETLALFQKELKPAPGKALTDKEAERLIGQLDDDSFAVREKASRELAEAGVIVRPLLLKALEAKPAAEKQRRLKELVDALAASAPPPELLRPTRALEVLERLDSAEARRLVEALANGNPSARFTADAEATRQRLKRRALLIAEKGD